MYHVVTWLVEGRVYDDDGAGSFKGHIERHGGRDRGIAEMRKDTTRSSN